MPTEDDEDLDLYVDLISEQLTEQLINDQQITCVLVCVDYSSKIWIFRKNQFFFCLFYGDDSIGWNSESCRQ